MEQNIKYYLIFKDGDNKVIRITRDSLQELYDIITEHKFPEGSYMIIKGQKVI